MRTIEKCVFDYFETDRNREMLKYLLNPQVSRLIKLLNMQPDKTEPSALYPIICEVGQKHGIKPVDISEITPRNNALDFDLSQITDTSLEEPVRECCRIIDDLTEIVKQYTPGD